MKYVVIAGLLSASMLMPKTAQAQGFSATITVDENCNGQFGNLSGFSASLSCGQIADPGPGGLAGAVTYSLLNPPGLVAGDLLLLDPGVPAPTVGSISDLAFSDVIRFDPDQTASDGSTGTLIFYSDDGTDSLADIGLPTATDTNSLIVTEGLDGVSYTPTSGQPGFISGADGPVTYVIVTNPEPASIVLMLGGAGLLFARKYLVSRFRCEI
jgi:hypothetical protein